MTSKHATPHLEIDVVMRFSAILFNMFERCNIRCRHCGYADSARKASISQSCLVDWVSQAISYGIPHVIFTGGEPFLDYALLETGAATVFARGRSSGVFTNCFWGESEEKAIHMLQGLPGLAELFLSCDKYHLEFVPATHVKHIIAAAIRLGIPAVRLCITYASDEEKDEVLGHFSDFAERISIYCSRVIRSDYIRLRVSNASENLVELRPENYSTTCFLQTPLVNPTGTVAICHMGKEETHGRVDGTPYSLGNLHEEALSKILARAETNHLYQLLRVRGPRAVAEAAASAGRAGEAYSNGCEMCFQNLRQPEVSRQLATKSLEPLVQAQIRLHRLLVLGDTISSCERVNTRPEPKSETTDVPAS